jgi:glutaredoxin 2
MMLRMVLGAKGIAYESVACGLLDQESAFDLGYADLPVLLWPDGRHQQGTVNDLAAIDQGHPQPALLLGPIAPGEWQAFLAWRDSLTALRERLIAPVLPAYAEIGGDAAATEFFRGECQRRFAGSIESLANDRYDAYGQMERRGRLRELARLLGQQGFYSGTLSLVDIILTADLHLLRLLDGVTVPLDLLYYFQRVATACGVSLEDGMAHHL